MPIQDEATINDLRNNKKCWCGVSGSVTNPAGNNPGCTACTSNKTPHTPAPVMVLRINTGVTALPRTECLVQRSYSPRKKADNNVAKTQLIFKWQTGEPLWFARATPNKIVPPI